jgi:hypothetical protein
MDHPEATPFLARNVPQTAADPSDGRADGVRDDRIPYNTTLF